MNKKSVGKVNAELERALAAELVEVSKKHEADAPLVDGQTKPAYKMGDFVYPVLDRMRVYDRALKLEAIKSKMSDDQYGGKFDR